MPVDQAYLKELNAKSKEANKSSQLHFKRAEELDQTNPTAAKHHVEASHLYDAAHVYYRNGREDLAEERSARAQQHAKVAQEHEQNSGGYGTGHQMVNLGEGKKYKG